MAAGSDDQTRAVVEAGAIDPLIDFLTCPNAQLRRQAVFCLANVGGSIPQYRIMLATHPKYFASMFITADMTSEPRILELICWNLRNVCLLGGPRFSDIKRGIEFFLTHIIKNYWNYPHWQPCMRFALETVCAASRHEEGREFLLQQNIAPDILTIVGHTETFNTSTNSAFEILAWIVAYGRDSDREAFVRDALAMNVCLERALPGYLGLPVQELALKALAIVATDQGMLLTVLNVHSELLDICGKLFLGLPAVKSPAGSAAANNIESGNSLAVFATVKACAGESALYNGRSQRVPSREFSSILTGCLCVQQQSSKSGVCICVLQRDRAANVYPFSFSPFSLSIFRVHFRSLLPAHSPSAPSAAAKDADD